MSFILYNLFGINPFPNSNKNILKSKRSKKIIKDIIKKLNEEHVLIRIYDLRYDDYIFYKDFFPKLKELLNNKDWHITWELINKNNIKYYSVMITPMDQNIKKI